MKERTYFYFSTACIVLGLALFGIPKFVRISCIQPVDLVFLSGTIFLTALASSCIVWRPTLPAKLYLTLIAMLVLVFYGVLVACFIWTSYPSKCKDINLISTIGLWITYIFIVHLLATEIRRGAISAAIERKDDAMSSLGTASIDMDLVSYPPQEGGQQKSPQVIHPPTKARVLYTYFPNCQDELSLTKGEVVDIIDSSGKWWKAKKKDGSIGIVASNYLEIIERADADTRLSF